MAPKHIPVLLPWTWEMWQKRHLLMWLWGTLRGRQMDRREWQRCNRRRTQPAVAGFKDKEADSPLGPPERSTGRPVSDGRTARSQSCVVWGAKFAVVCCGSNGKLWQHVDFVMSWAGHLESSGSLGYVQIFPVLMWFITQSQRIINITLISSENSLNIRKLSRAHSNYPKFSLENFNFILGNKYCQRFSLKWQTNFMHSWKMSSKYWSLNNQLVSQWFLKMKMGLGLD